MPEDDRNRRRLGDATKERIADLAEGWSVDSPASPPAAAPDPGPAPSGRKKPRTVPPPPPGSLARKALEDAIVETAKTPDPDRVPTTPRPPAESRSKPATAPPPIPPLTAAARAKAPTRPPSPAGTPPIHVAPAKSAPAKSAPVAVPPAKSGRVVKERTPSVIVEPEVRTSDPNLVVPVGEFDAGGFAASDPKLRAAFAQQETIKRDAAEALLQIPDTTERGDPTTIDGGDAPHVQPASDAKTATGGRLRKAAALRRQRGLLGDARYVFTAMLGVRRARRELAGLEQRQTKRQDERRRHLVTLGRTAVAADTHGHSALATARDKLAAVEDERSQHAGSVAAADAELERVRRDRAAKIADHAAQLAKCDAELAELAKKLEPLDKEAAVVRRRADELRGEVARIDKKIAETEASRVSVKADRDPAAIQAELATLRADRASVTRDEPRIAAELDELNPRIAGIEAKRSDAQKRRRDLEQAEADDQRRTAELLEAIGAKRKVVDRAAGEAEASRDKVLFELGERLYVERPKILAAQLAPIDAIDLELGETDRHIMELREILSNVDKAKLARGATAIALVAIAVGLVVAWFVYLAL